MNDELQKAKIKRAKELVVEAGDMDMGDAAVMFMLAAVEAQHKCFVTMCEQSMEGKPIQGMPPEEEKLWAVIVNVLGPDFKNLQQKFFKSKEFEKHMDSAVLSSLTNLVPRTVIAFRIMLKLEEAGKEL